MTNNQDLDELVRKYLHAPGLDQPRLIPKLVEFGSAIVLPLLNAALESLNWSSPLLPRNMSRDAQNVFYSVWRGAILNGVVHNTYAVIASIGQEGWNAICRALSERNEGIQVLAILILLENKNPSDRTVNDIDFAIRNINKQATLTSPDPIPVGAVKIYLLPRVIMSKDAKIDKLIRERAKENGRSLEQDYEHDVELAARFLYSRYV